MDRCVVCLGEIRLVLLVKKRLTFQKLQIETFGYRFSFAHVSHCSGALSQVDSFIAKQRGRIHCTHNYICPSPSASTAPVARAAAPGRKPTPSCTPFLGHHSLTALKHLPPVPSSPHSARTALPRPKSRLYARAPTHRFPTSRHLNRHRKRNYPYVGRAPLFSPAASKNDTASRGVAPRTPWRRLPHRPT